ncbi:MAG TPA: Gfo/Idh/MocA family oxidoreductase, partial [Flavisolibacter sp.]|nr:Gfo/Idh/MocA family oxidoreductase [Flavisolibacter sp.]
AQSSAFGAGADTTPVKLPIFDDPSEGPTPAPPAPLHPDKRVGYALVGLGHLTLDELLPAFGQCEYSKPVALVSGDAAKARKVADQYGIDPKSIYNYQNYDDIKNNPAIQAVYIVLPNSMHEEFTIRSAAAGKHVLCEKPMANTSAEAKRMIDACKKAAKKLMIAYRIQYEPKNRMVMKWVRNNKWGKVRLIEMFNGQNIANTDQWRLKKKLAGGGSLPDIGIYCLNTARFLLGEEPEWVNASLFSTPGDPRFKEVEENVLFQMGFPGGTLVNAATGYSVHQSRRYRCLADKGGWFGLDPAFAYHGLQMEVSEVRDGQDWREHPEVPEKNQFALEIDHMSQCILYNKEPYTPGEEGLQDHRIMEAIYQSAKEKKAIQLERITKIDAFRGTPPKEGA